MKILAELEARFKDKQLQMENSPDEAVRNNWRRSSVTRQRLSLFFVEAIDGHSLKSRLFREVYILPKVIVVVYFYNDEVEFLSAGQFFRELVLKYGRPTVSKAVEGDD